MTVTTPETTSSPTRERLEALLRHGLAHEGRRWAARRAWSADLDDPAAGVVVELEDPSGCRVGAHVTADRTVVEDVDPALGVLPAGRVVGVRPRKRAVVVDVDGRFVKVARRTATRRARARAEAVERLLAAHPRPTQLPARPRIVEHVDTAPGRLVLQPLAGVPLTEVLASTSRSGAREVGEQVGRALAALADVTPDQARSLDVELPRHGAADEARALRRWARSATALAPLSPAERRLLTDRVPAVADELERLPSPPSEVLVHRDLHDGQILVGADGLAFLDWDTAAFADPRIDLANLIAHVQRARDLDLVDRDNADDFVDGLLTTAPRAGHAENRGPRVGSGSSLALLVEAARLRLVAVHAFRRTT